MSQRTGTTNVHPPPFEISPLSKAIWESKYRYVNRSDQTGDSGVDDTWRRVAKAAAAAEPGGRSEKAKWRKRFFDAMASFSFLPAGRIMAGAGTPRDVTLFNCFVMDQLDDDLALIFDGVRNGALTMQQGGGIGQDFSTLRPRGAMVTSVGADASGPVSFMDVWDSMCLTIMSAGARRGAMMGTLRCDHPDIEEFVAAKMDPERLRNFNMSVLVTDAFIQAVRSDATWPLVFAGKVYRTLPARKLWDRIMRATFEYAEPGVIFIDRVNARNNLAYCESIYATNPCGEQPLPPSGACLLGSVNLARLVPRPFENGAAIDLSQLEEHVRTAVRFLDNIIDVSRMPLPAQKREAQAKRRIGLGITGLADALIFCGLRYDTDAARTQAAKWMQTIQNAAYVASAELASEKGAFPLCDTENLLASLGIQNLEPVVREEVGRFGLRNGCLTSIAPTGTISLLAGNVSSGIEPVFDLSFNRAIRDADGEIRNEQVEDYAYALFSSRHRSAAGSSGEADLPDTFVIAAGILPKDHVAMQAALQPYVDSSISKTINCPEDISFEAFKDIYLDAYDQGLKGCTTFRPNRVTGSVLSGTADGPAIGSEAVPPHLEVEVAQTGKAAPDAGQDVVYMSPPLEREPVLAGQTYKLKWPASDHAIYVTVNDIEQGGRCRPFEIFINTKNLEHYAWTVALTRMISAVFRRGGDVTFVVEELKAVFDPQGGQWMNGRYVPSLLAAIGDVIEQHMLTTGFLREPVELAGLVESGVSNSGPKANQGNGRGCQRCGRRELFRHEGCWTCHACGFTRC